MSQTLHAPEGGVRRALVASLDRLEVRQAGNGEDYTITGHAAVFDKWSEDLSTFVGSFREKIAPGAFAGALAKKPDVRLLFNHDGLALARTKSNTLELSEDEEGLRVWARVSGQTSLGNDLRVAMERGDIDQMSFAFTVAEDEWREDNDAGIVERTIIRVDELFDVSAVTYPAYPDTDAAVRELRAAASAGLVSRLDDGDTHRVEVYIDGNSITEAVRGRMTTTASGTAHGGWLTTDEVREAEGLAPPDTPEASALDEERAEEAAQAETDPAGDAESRDAVADGNDDSNAPAETDPVAETDPLAALKRASTEAKQAAKDDLIRLTKEMLK